MLSLQVETIADTYMTACGVPNAEQNNPIFICKLALDMLHQANSVAIEGKRVKVFINIIYS